MARRKFSVNQNVSFGQVMLGVYILAVIIITVIRDTGNSPFIAQLASTPAAILHGSWWQLFTSGLIIDGPWLPQVASLAALGTMSIYFRGSLLFWITALAGHVFGTLLTYAGVGIAWLIHPNWVRGVLQQQDYGISLVWCAALGIVAAAAWLGPDSSRGRAYKPVALIASVAVMTVVTWYSVGLARYEHLTAFILAFLIVTLTPQHRRMSKHLDHPVRRHRSRKAAA